MLSIFLLHVAFLVNLQCLLSSSLTIIATGILRIVTSLVLTVPCAFFLQTLFLGEGEDMDYEVSSLFGADSTYNLFGKKTVVLAGSSEQPSVNNRASAKMSAARRFLREGAVYTPVVRVGGLM